MEVNIMNKKINELKPILIESFTEFYGEIHKKRIESVIDSIAFVYFSKYENKYLGSSNEDRIKNDETLRGRIEKVKDVDGCCFPHTQPPVIALTLSDELIANFLIHEINHTLHNKIIDNTNIGFSSSLILIKLYQEGITNNDYKLEDSSKNLIYEIINEYMSKEILEIFRKKNTDKSINCNDIPLEYISVDNISNNLVKKIYFRMKEFIKQKLIIADGQCIRDVIGKNNYIILNKKLEKLFNLYNSFFIKYKLKTKDDKILPTTIEKLFIDSFKENNDILPLNEFKELNESIIKSFNDYNWIPETKNNTNKK